MMREGEVMEGGREWWRVRGEGEMGSIGGGECKGGGSGGEYWREW